MTLRLLPTGPSSHGGEADVVGGRFYSALFSFHARGKLSVFFLIDALLGRWGQAQGGLSGTVSGSAGGSGSGRTGGDTMVMRCLGVPRRTRLVGVAGVAVLLRRRRRGEVH